MTRVYTGKIECVCRQKNKIGSYYRLEYNKRFQRVSNIRLAITVGYHHYGVSSLLFTFPIVIFMPPHRKTVVRLSFCPCVHLHKLNVKT